MNLYSVRVCEGFYLWTDMEQIEAVSNILKPVKTTWVTHRAYWITEAGNMYKVYSHWDNFDIILRPPVLITMTIFPGFCEHIIHVCVLNKKNELARQLKQLHVGQG